MRFLEPRRFFSEARITVEEYLSRDLGAYLKDLITGLTRLNYEDNFLGIKWEGSIEAGQEIRIPHTLGRVPREYQVTFARGSIQVMAGDEDWTTDYVTFKNNATSSTFTGIIRIFP